MSERGIVALIFALDIVNVPDITLPLIVPEKFCTRVPMPEGPVHVIFGTVPVTEVVDVADKELFAQPLPPEVTELDIFNTTTADPDITPLASVDPVTVTSPVHATDHTHDPPFEAVLVPLIGPANVWVGGSNPPQVFTTCSKAATQLTTPVLYVVQQ